MTVGKRIWLSFVIGWSIKLIPLSIYVLFENQVTALIAGITNVDVIMATIMFSGKTTQTTIGHVLIVALAFLSGLIIYPTIIFVILTIWNRFKRTNLTRA